QRKPWPAGGGKRTRTVPVGANHHANSGELVFGLYYCIVSFTGFFVYPHFFRIHFKCFRHRCRGCYRVPGNYRSPAINSPEAAGSIAVNHYLVADKVASFQAHIQRVYIMIVNILYAKLQRLYVWRNEFFFAVKLLNEQLLQHFKLDAEQGRQSPHINNIFKQLPLARISKFAEAYFHQGHTYIIHVFTYQFGVQRLGAVIQKVTAAFNRTHVVWHALRVYGNHKVNAFAPAEVAFFAYTNFVPGRQALYVRRENIFWGNRDTHPENCLGKKIIGACRTGTINICKTYYKIIYFT